MKLKPYVEKLESSKEYETFRKENKDAFVVAGFFVIDFEQGRHIHQIDFYAPKSKKVAAFTLDSKVTLQLMNLMGKKIPEELDIDTKIDLDALKGILTDEMRNRNITEEITKMIAVIQTVKGKKIWNVNCVLSGMEILKAHVDDSSETVLKLERVSMTDLIKKIPKQLQAAPNKKPTKEDAKQALSQLQKMEEQILKEKERLQQELQAEHSEVKKK
ncbi:hypothetical protein J4402_05210 [Candidatus Pacearchaeota archaeon]|nr:hypothetical protein [Candidatus Pacearchaeota archaeon]